MKAVVYTRYGPPDVLNIKEIDQPTPNDDEVLVDVYATSINYSDLALVRGKPFLIRLMTGGLLKPKYTILGKDIAGRVEAVGKNVQGFHPGDEVWGDLSLFGFGAFAEFVTVPERALALKPANICFEESAAVPEAAVVALQGLRDQGEILTGQKVLIVGASGGIGTFAVQIAKSFGAEVTGVCSTRNLDLVRAIGADHVIDYTQEDFAQNEARYDLILATAGYRSLFDYQRALRPEGIYVVTGGTMAQIFQPMVLGPVITMTGRKKIRNLTNRPNQKDLDFMRELIETGKVSPVIDRSYSLDQVPEAIRFYAQGHARGKVVITLQKGPGGA